MDIKRISMNEKGKLEREYTLELSDNKTILDLFELNKSLLPFLNKLLKDKSVVYKTINNDKFLVYKNNVYDKNSIINLLKK